MKASLKFREEHQKPLFKAKVPLNILGLPFQSGLAAGDSKELCLSLGTFFDFGPAFRVSYRPNDTFNPFSLIVKTGIGHFGSPVEAPITMTAEFNFLSKNPSSISNPRFFLHFKPQFGDFSLKKSHSSAIRELPKEEDATVEIVEKPPSPSPAIDSGEYFSVGKKMTTLPLKMSSVEGAVSGMELGAKTVLPILNGAVLKLRWGLKFPEGFEKLFTKARRDSTAGMSPRGIPLLVLNKIGIEHVADDKKEVVGPNPKEGGPQVGGGSADLAETCFMVKRQLETLRGENALLGKALEDMRVEFANTKGKFKGVGERKSGESNGVEGDGV